MNRIVLAYSGGLISTALMVRLAEIHRAEIIAVTLDIGQGGTLEEVRDRALAAGARRAHVLDVRDEFAADYVLPALKADLCGGDPFPMSVELSWPLVARKLVEIAGIEQTDRVAHGFLGRSASGSVETAIRSLNPALTIVGPDRTLMPGRDAALKYARSHGLKLAAGVDSPLRVDANLWGRTVTWTTLEGGTIRGAPAEMRSLHADDLYSLTGPIDRAVDHAASVDVAFERGTPVGINGVQMSFVELIANLSMIAGAHGVGRVHPRSTSGLRTAGDPQEVREAPAAAALHAAHQALIEGRLSNDVRRLYATAGEQYADLVRRGLWFTPMRAALDAFVVRVHNGATGVVRLSLSKGTCTVTRAPELTLGPASGLLTADCRLGLPTWTDDWQLVTGD